MSSRELQEGEYYDNDGMLVENTQPQQQAQQPNVTAPTSDPYGEYEPPSDVPLNTETTPQNTPSSEPVDSSVLDAARAVYGLSDADLQGKSQQQILDEIAVRQQQYGMGGIPHAGMPNQQMYGQPPYAQQPYAQQPPMQPPYQQMGYPPQQPNGMGQNPNQQFQQPQQPEQPQQFPELDQDIEPDVRKAFDFMKSQVEQQQQLVAQQQQMLQQMQAEQQFRPIDNKLDSLNDPRFGSTISGLSQVQDIARKEYFDALQFNVQQMQARGLPVDLDVVHKFAMAKVERAFPKSPQQSQNRQFTGRPNPQPNNRPTRKQRGEANAIQMIEDAINKNR